jgi:hypothetical protein
VKRRAAVDRDALAAEIAGLSKRGIDELRERWKAMYGKAASRETGRSFLMRAIAYRLQERAYGGGQHSRGGSFFAIKPVRSASIPRSGREDPLACLSVLLSYAYTIRGSADCDGTCWA